MPFWATDTRPGLDITLPGMCHSPRICTRSQGCTWHGDLLQACGPECVTDLVSKHKQIPTTIQNCHSPSNLPPAFAIGRQGYAKTHIIRREIPRHVQLLHASGSSHVFHHLFSTEKWGLAGYQIFTHHLSIDHPRTCSFIERSTHPLALTTISRTNGLCPRPPAVVGEDCPAYLVVRGWHVP